MGSRVITAVNWVIGLVLLAVLALLYWFAWRPLPQRSGSISAQVSRPVNVQFDALGVPHIHALTENDAFFVQGYVTAQDRLWQMEGLRRVSAGEIAEIIGPAGLEIDRASRRLLMRRAAEAAYAHMPAQDRTAFIAYTRGVNAYLSGNKRLPVEFTLLGYTPRPWREVDSVLICLYMFRDLTTTWSNDLVKRAMLRQGDAQKVQFLFPPRAGNEAHPGSNAWAVAGSRTATGRPLLSNDMHLEYSLPGIWYMTHLQAPGLEVAGVALPGVPGIIVGHNRNIAWGITNLQFDVQDLYIEKIDERTGHYTYRGKEEQAQPAPERILVKGARPEVLLVWVTRHGPVFVTENGDHMALHWVAHDASVFQYPIIEINRAQNWKQFNAALARFPGPGSNFVYADAAGNIGYHVAGKLPKRHGFAGDLPLDGSTGQFEWDGYIPYDELPSSLNPPRGIIVTANQNPFPPDYPYPVNGTFAPPSRSVQILERLSSRTGWTAADMLNVQTDIYSGWMHFLARQVVAAYDQRHAPNTKLEAGANLLRGWNGQMDKDMAAPFLISLIYLHLRTAAGRVAAPQAQVPYEFTLAPAALEHLLRERPAGWFRDYNEALTDALREGMEEGARMQGSDTSRWKYGAYLSVRIDHPVIHQVPWVGSYFDIGPVPMSGSTTSIKQTTRALAPSMRMTADTSAWEHSQLSILTGQSGEIFSSHYRDQWDAYYAGRSFPMQFQAVAVKSTLDFQPAK